MEKKKKGGDKWKKKQKKKLKKLPKSVAKASRHLCRKILRYEGEFISVIVYHCGYFTRTCV